MSDTPTLLDPNRADAHYAADVTTPKRRRNVELTPEQQESIARVRAAVEALAEAERAQSLAFAERARVIREEWSAHLSEVGYTRIAREVGGGIGEGTVRGIVSDLRAAQRAKGE
jgi:hypothetical protein